MRICYICEKEIKGKSIVLEVRKGKDIRMCEYCMGEVLLMRIAKGERYDHNLEGMVNELKEMKASGHI